MKTISATKLMSNREKVYDAVCARQPVRLVSRDRWDIVLVLATDYEQLKLDLEQAQAELAVIEFEKTECE